MEKWKRILIWTGQILFGFLFILIGLTKVQASTSVIAQFEGWGIPMADKAIYIVGAIEICGGIGLLIPRTARLAATGLVVVMAGAFVTHLVNAEWARLIVPLLFGTLLILIRHVRAQGPGPLDTIPA